VAEIIAFDRSKTGSTSADRIETITLLAEQASSVIDAAERQLDAKETLTRLLAASDLLVQLTSVLAPGAQEAHARRIMRDIESKVATAQRVLIATPPSKLPGLPLDRP
jgi:hypothetical protein